MGKPLGRVGENNQDYLIVDEAVRFMYTNIGSISVVQLFFPVAIAWMFWHTIPRLTIIIWTILVLCVYAARIVMARRFETSDVKAGDHAKWAEYFTWTSLVSGTLWGSAGILFYTPESVNLQVLLYVLIVGVAAGSLVVTCYWLPAFFAYAIPSVGLVALNLLVRAEAPGKILAILLILYLVIFAQIARRTREMMYHAIKVQFENLSLVEELKRQKDLAETANRAKTRFLASANHDLRQPVHALSLMTYAAKDELSTPRGQKLYDSMNRTVSSLSQLLESLLDLSRLDAGAMSVHREDVSLRPLGGQLLTEFLPLAQRKNLRLGVGPFDYCVSTDIALVGRILRNLLGNAVHYTQTGGVLIGCRRRGDTVVIEVWDTGIGIDTSDSGKVFTEFYQGNNPDHDRTQGLGLGLSICKRIADLLGHQFTFESKRSAGSVFRLTLPLSQTEINPPQINAWEINDHKDQLCGTRILIIDDERIVREALSQVLRSWGVEVILAGSGLEALNKLGRHAKDAELDAIICDYRLGSDENGIDAIRLLREAVGDKDLAAMILTGDTAPDLVKEFKQTEFPVLHKPLNPNELFGHLSILLKRTECLSSKGS